MTAAFETTFEVLSNSRNEAVVPILIGALDSSDGGVYERAISALVARRSKAGHLAVLSRWHLLSPKQRELIPEGRGRMSGALRDAVLSEEEQLFKNACELVEEFTEFDLVPTLVTLAENKKSEHAQAATELVVRLVNRLSEMVHGQRDKNDRRDAKAIRRNVLESLERSVERFRRHERAELIEAFVILAGHSCDLLRIILDDPRHPCYDTVVNTLANSQSTSVIELLISFLKTANASLGILNVISRRVDEPFVEQLLECTSALSEQKIGVLADRTTYGTTISVSQHPNSKSCQSTSAELTPEVRKNLGRIGSFSWLLPDDPGMERFSEQDQTRCVKLITNSGMKQEDLLSIIESVLTRGEPAGRCAACEALTSIPGDRPSQLVLHALRDTDPAVQAAATRQLRDRHLPGTMALLLKLIDSPHEIVRDACRESLDEFSFENFLARFETLNDDARRSTGAVVCKVDTETVPCLLAEMENKSRRARMRAIEMAEVMQLIPEICEGLLALLEDEDHLVRAAAADALQLCQTPEIHEALLHATSDKSTAVQNAAKNSLATFVALPVSASANAIGAIEG